MWFASIPSLSYFDLVSVRVMVPVTVTCVSSAFPPSSRMWGFGGDSAVWGSHS